METKRKQIEYEVKAYNKSNHLFKRTTFSSKEKALAMVTDYAYRGFKVKMKFYYIAKKGKK
jgi:hypothetical protein